MKKFIYIILALFLFFTNNFVNAADYTIKDVKAVSKDGFNINAKLMYPKDKTRKEFSTVVLLHSLGYSSQWWGTLPQDLLAQGYAVLTIDLRGHGKSIYNSKLKKTSWKDMTVNSLSKTPYDVIAVIETVKKDNVKKSFFNNWAIVGSDLGASAGVFAADKLTEKPKTIVMISPSVEVKGVKILTCIAQLDNVDFLTISGTGEPDSQKASRYLKRYAQAGFSEYTSKSRSAGMILLKNDPELCSFIKKWLMEYLD